VIRSTSGPRAISQGWPGQEEICDRERDCRIAEKIGIINPQNPSISFIDRQFIEGSGMTAARRSPKVFALPDGHDANAKIF
jgi:hypothetical protein